ncbi:MAG: MerR family transcriptional regulator [Terriglobales bacterium]
MQIGAVAAAAGVKVDTVRFYERQRVLPVAPRAANGYRAYSAAAIERLRIIRQLQGLGLTLAQIRELLQAAEGAPACTTVQERLIAQRRKLREQIGEMEALDRSLARWLAACKRNLKSGHAGSCPALR